MEKKKKKREKGQLFLGRGDGDKKNPKQQNTHKNQTHTTFKRKIWMLMDFYQSLEAFPCKTTILVLIALVGVEGLSVFSEAPM